MLRAKVVSFGILGCAVAAVPGISAADGAASAGGSQETIPPDAPSATTVTTVAVAPAESISSAVAASSNFSWLTDNGGGGSASANISGVVRQVVTAFSDKVYRDVGVPVIGTKTIKMSGTSKVLETHGYLSDAGTLADVHECSGSVISLSGGFPLGASVSISPDNKKETWSRSFGAGTSLQKNVYTNMFQCRTSSSAITARSTKSVIGSMTFKNTAVISGGSGSFSW